MVYNNFNTFNNVSKGKTIDFKAFWDAYGKKRDRQAAERVWQRLSARDRRAAVAGIPAYREACLRDGVAMMYGQGYLSHRRWEDEIDDPAQEPRRDGILFVAQDGGLPDLEPFEDMELW